MRRFIVAPPRSKRTFVELDFGNQAIRGRQQTDAVRSACGGAVSEPSACGSYSNVECATRGAVDGHVQLRRARRTSDRPAARDGLADDTHIAIQLADLLE
jgi:hypothetical protein